MFDYTNPAFQIPYLLKGQSRSNELWINEDMSKLNLVFQFPSEKHIGNIQEQPPWYDKLLWRYTIEHLENSGGDKTQKRALSTGFFKLNKYTETTLDLRVYESLRIKWIRFTVFYIENPQQRAWFSPIKGDHFPLESGKKKQTFNSLHCWQQGTIFFTVQITSLDFPCKSGKFKVKNLI